MTLDIIIRPERHYAQRRYGMKVLDSDTRWRHVWYIPPKLETIHAYW